MKDEELALGDLIEKMRQCAESSFGRCQNKFVFHIPPSLEETFKRVAPEAKYKVVTCIAGVRA